MTRMTRTLVMRCVLTPLSCLGFVGLAVASVEAQAGGQSLAVRAENTLTIGRSDETIGIPWTTVRDRLAGAQPGHVRVMDPAADREVISQAVDNDGDGQVDELIFQATFAAGEIKRFVIDGGTPNAKPVKARVFAMHTDPRDDVAWESDRIAFRIYGQGLWKVDSLLSSGVDVWVKRVRDPIVEKWYAKGHDEYHRDTGEGADFFDVGQTLGAGGTGIWREGKLYRAYNFKTWRILANGPVRTIFELQYEPWDAAGLRVTETKRVTLDAGQNLNHVTSIFRSQGTATDIPFVTGLVKRKGVIGSESMAQPWAWLTVWGAVNPKDGGHGDLGTAVLLPRDRLVDWKETSDHYLALSRAKSGEGVSYYIGAGWTDSGDFRDVREWWTYLDQCAQRLTTPIAVTLGQTAR
jgi:pectinesterase